MARLEYGGSLADFTTTPAGLIRGGLDLYVWSARIGGTRVNDLIGLSGGTMTDDIGGRHLVTGPSAAIDFLGPDGYDGDGLWVSAAPSPDAPRLRLRALLTPVAGGGGGGGTPAPDNTFEYVQATPSASWTITHALGRRPAVTLYVAGIEVDADVSATASQVSITFPAPTAGSAVLA